MKQYSYDGPVMEFGRIIANRWQATTSATSEKKALNNLAYRFKMQNNKIPSAKIKLPGKLVVVS